MQIILKLDKSTLGWSYISNKTKNYQFERTFFCFFLLVGQIIFLTKKENKTSILIFPYVSNRI